MIYLNQEIKSQKDEVRNKMDYKKIAETFAYVLDNMDQNIKFGPAQDFQKIERFKQQINSEKANINGEIKTIREFIDDVIG